MIKIQKHIFLVGLLLVVNFSFGQIIKVRKGNKKIIGKTLKLYDIRQKECGEITINNENSCSINFRLDTNEIKYLKLIPFKIPVKEEFNCTYSLISDTSFEIKHKDYIDTCSFLFLDENNNAAKLKNTPYGIFDQNNFAVFFHLDSIVYSQSYKQSFADSKFTDSISKIDTVYKYIRDKKKRERLEETLKERLKAYKSTIKSEFFRGNYKVEGVKIMLSENNNPAFGKLLFTRDSVNVSVFSKHHFEKEFPLISEYTHKQYGSIKFKYNKCYLNYFDPKTKVNRFKATKFLIFKRDTFSVNYLTKSKPDIYSETDTFAIKNTEFLGNSKLVNVIGGFYSTYLLALNGNKIKFKDLYFKAETAVEMKNKKIILPLNSWKYSVQNNILFLYNNKDTLVDEMKNGYESFSFTYRNNEPYVFGAYHFKSPRIKEHHYLILFPNQTGIKYTTTNFDYKTARESVFKGKIKLPKEVKRIKFTYSSTSEFLWIEYKNGNYERLDFFNFNKGIRNSKKRYYLLGSSEVKE